MGLNRPGHSSSSFFASAIGASPLDGPGGRRVVQLERLAPVIHRVERLVREVAHHQGARLAPDRGLPGGRRPRNLLPGDDRAQERLDVDGSGGAHGPIPNFWFTALLGVVPPSMIRFQRASPSSPWALYFFW